MQTLKSIGTHSGHFHADEVLATMMLYNYTAEYKNAKITRTRDPTVLEKLDIIVDVGGVYEPSNHRYDHHQRGFTEKFNEKSCTVLSSAGLVYKHFGREVLYNILKNIVEEVKLKYQPPQLNEENIEIVYNRLYENFIKSVDAIDNGVNQYGNGVGQSKYQTLHSFEQRIGHMNPMWTEDADENERFREAMKIADHDLNQAAKGIFLSWLPARKFVEDAIKTRFEVHESGEIIKFPQSVPWKSHLNDLESELNIEGIIKFVLFSTKEEGWRIQAVNKTPDSFELRKGLKAEWRGIKDMEELKKVSEIPDIVFIHGNGFIGGARSYESALKIGIMSLNY